MAFTNNPYCQRQDVVLALDPNINQADFAFIDSLIPIAQAALDRAIGYPFQQDGTVSSPAQRLYDGSGMTHLWIDDLVSLTSVIETFQYAVFTNGVWILGNPTTTDITVDTIALPPNYTAVGVPAHKLTRRSGLPFQEGRLNYQVNGVFGYPITPGQIYTGIPADITRACVRLVTHYYRMRDTAYADLVQAQGGIREHYEKGWPPDVMEIVRAYRHQRFYSRVPGEGTGWVFLSGN